MRKNHLIHRRFVSAEGISATNKYIFSSFCFEFCFQNVIMITTVLTCILPRKSFLNFFRETWSCPTNHFLLYLFLHFSLTSRACWLPQTSDILVMVMCGYIARYANPSCNQKRDFCPNIFPRFQHFHFSVRN